MIRFCSLALALAGCSFALVSSAPEHAHPDATCTESRAAPIADTVIGSGLAVGGAALIAAPNHCSYANQNDCTASNVGQGAAEAMGAVLLITGVVYAISAFRGFSATGECRRLHARS